MLIETTYTENILDTTPTEPTFDLREQMARIDQALEEAARARAEIAQRNRETQLVPAKLLVQGEVMIAALLGAGAAIAALFLS